MPARHLKKGRGTQFTGAMVISITRFVGQDANFCSPRCKIWYQRVVETSTTESKQRSTVEAGVIMQDNMSVAPHSQKRQRNHEEELDEKPANFRRVRLRYSDQTQELGSGQVAQETEIGPNGNMKTSRNEAPATQADSLGISARMAGVIASIPTDILSSFYADAGLTITGVAVSSLASKFLAAKYSSAPREDLRHPIGGSYIPNAQLVCSSDEESDTPTAEKPDWYDRAVFGSPPAEDDEHNRSSFFLGPLLGEDHAAPTESLKL